MSRHSDGDIIASTTGRSHCRQKLYVLEAELGHVFQVVEEALIAPGSNQLDRWLRTIDFDLGHIQVVDKDNSTFANRWPIDAFAATIHFGHDRVLRLFRCRPR